MENVRYVYVVLSQTPTKFGTMIRNVTSAKYNHASLAFDEELEQLYSFGRAQHEIPMKAGLVKEFRERFSLNKAEYVACKIYRIPVSWLDYARGLDMIKQIKGDTDGYMYNLFSVLTFPMFHGFATYKTFTCVEFTAYMLRLMHVKWESRRHNCKYLPQQLGDELERWSYFEGNLLSKLKPSPEESEQYFKKSSRINTLVRSIEVLIRLGYRKMRYL